MLEYDGKMHLKGMAKEEAKEETVPLFPKRANEKEYVIREATEEEKKLAKSLGIKVMISSNEHLEKILDIQNQIIRDVKKEQQKLIQIVLEKTDAKSRLSNIRQVLLEFKLEKKEEQTSSADANLNLNFSTLISKISKISINEMKELSNIVDNAFALVFNHAKLVDRIAEVIRSSDVTDEEKIDRITDLLI